MNKKEKYESLANLNYKTQMKITELLEPWKEYGYESTLEGGLEQLRHEITDIVLAAKIDYEVSEGIVVEYQPVKRMIEALENRFNKLEKRLKEFEKHLAENKSDQDQKSD